MKLSIFGLCIVVFFGEERNAQTIYLDKVSNYVTLMDLYRSGDYNMSMTDIIPLVDDTKPMIIKAEVELYSLNDFDEISGRIELSTSVTFNWTDEVVQAVTGLTNSLIFNINYGNESLLVTPDKIWTPKIVLDNSISSEPSIGGNEYMCRYTLITGDVTWSPKILIKSACSPDVTFYPFDRQTCQFSFVAWRFTASEIQLQAARSEWILNSLEDDGQWQVVETNSKNEVVNDQSYLRLFITIERKPLYFAFNIILPILLLSFLNLMVFWLPSESGERVGFAVTCFLSFVVLLNTIMEILPRTSSPMSYLCYYVVVMMIFSGLVTTLTVIQVRIFHKFDDVKVPSVMKTFVGWFRCKGRKNKGNSLNVSKSTVVPELKDTEATNGNMEWNHIEPRPSTSLAGSDPDLDSMTDVTWGDVSRVFDLLFFLGFLGTQIFFSITFLLPVAFN